MKRVLLTISYDGTAYHGWQVQPNGITVQQVMQDGLEKILGVRPAVTGCSRTDAGVHAKEFCCHFDCDENIPHTAFLRGLNAVLPSDIAVKCSKTVPDDFHARYAAKGKNYIYQTYCSETKDAFLSRYALRLEQELNPRIVNEFCTSLLGTHNFAPFSCSGRTVSDTVRTVTECFVRKEEGITALHITADGFLYNMVRIIMGTAIAVSNGRFSPDCANAIFQTGDRALAGPTVPPNGLFLNKVFY